MVKVYVGLLLMGLVSGLVVLADPGAWQQALQFADSHIALVWPITPAGADAKIEQHLSSAGQILYRQAILLNKILAKQLLRHAHPQIVDLEKHFRWYFPGHTLSKPLRVYIVRFANLAEAVATKRAIRKLFNLGYRAIHINDTPAEAQELAQLLFR